MQQELGKVFKKESGVAASGRGKLYRQLPLGDPPIM